MAYEITCAAGVYVLVTSADILGPELGWEDEGWSAGVYCTGCGETHDQHEHHGNAMTDESTADALVATVRDAMLSELRTALYR